MSSSNLAIPSGPLARRASRSVLVSHGERKVWIGGDAPIVVQSMTNTDTADVAGTVKQVADLWRAGSELVRVTVQAAGQQIGLVPGGGPQGMTSPVAYWHVPDIEAKLAEVTAAGATVKEPAHDVGGGRLVATVTDPDGNVLGLLQDR